MASYGSWKMKYFNAMVLILAEQNRIKRSGDGTTILHCKIHGKIFKKSFKLPFYNYWPSERNLFCSKQFLVLPFVMKDIYFYQNFNQIFTLKADSCHILGSLKQFAANAEVLNKVLNQLHKTYLDDMYIQLLNVMKP